MLVYQRVREEDPIKTLEESRVMEQNDVFFVCIFFWISQDLYGDSGYDGLIWLIFFTMEAIGDPWDGGETWGNHQFQWPKKSGFVILLEMI